MGGAEPTAETTLAVILGASEFKDPNFTPSKAFEKSAQDFRAYLLDPKGLGLPFENLLYLFDFLNEATQLDDMVVDFLKSRVTQESERPKPRDLIFYYVGHGAFSSPGDEYFLAVRATRSPNRFQTGYSVAMLANTLKEYATYLRRYLILDSCFSAAAYAAFQSTGPLEVAKQKTLAEFPGKGTGLLCAAGPKDPAKVLPGQVHTMFSGALLEALRKGSLQLDERLSLLQLGDLTLNLTRERFPDDAVRPEAHAPDMRQGSLVELPFFPNAARREIEWRQHVSRLEQAISALKARQNDLEKQHQDLEDTLPERLDKVVEALKAQNEQFKKDQSELQESVSRLLAKAIDGDGEQVQSEKGRVAKVSGLLWLGLSLVICLLGFGKMFVFFREPIPELISSTLYFMSGLSYFLVISLQLAHRQDEALPSIDEKGRSKSWFSEMRWYRVAASHSPDILLFNSIRMTSVFFTIATLLYTMTLVCSSIPHIRSLIPP